MRGQRIAVIGVGRRVNHQYFTPLQRRGIIFWGSSFEFASQERAMTVTVSEAKAQLSELIQQLSAGEEVVVTENDQPVARLLAPAVSDAPRQPRQFGTLKGTVLYMAPDFDAPLDDFKEYME
jgi:prevent-host-death family protein